MKQSALTGFVKNLHCFIIVTTLIEFLFGSYQSLFISYSFDDVCDNYISSCGFHMVMAETLISNILCKNSCVFFNNTVESGSLEGQVSIASLEGKIIDDSDL